MLLVSKCHDHMHIHVAQGEDNYLQSFGVAVLETHIHTLLLSQSTSISTQLKLLCFLADTMVCVPTD